MPKPLIIATRESPLALWQARYIAARIGQLRPGQAVELLGMTTTGDQLLDSPLSQVGGKGLFVKELEQAMLDGRADLAVHSMKDVPVELPPGFCLAAICEREDPLDAFVSNKYSSFDELPVGARLGTASLRRQSQLQGLRPDIRVKTLRGNVNTRLRKLDNGDFDAIVLASAGLKRLQMEQRIAARIAPEICLPAPGQGALGLECRADDANLRALLDELNHAPSAALVQAERAMNRRLEGGCSVPVGAYAITEADGGLWLRGLVAAVDGSVILRAEARAPAAEAEALGDRVAGKLLQQGAAELLATLRATD